MMRTAAARALVVVLTTTAVLCALAALPNRALAQQPKGAGTAEPSTSQPQSSEAPPQQSAPAPAPSAQAPPPPESAKSSKAKAKAKASRPAASSSAHDALAEFAWLAGRWQGEWGPRTAQQVWMPPQSGVIVGVFQLTEDTHTLVVELYSIMATSQGIELRVRHFTPALTPWEKSGPSLLKLMTYDSKSFLFVNQDNGQPKHWVMKRSDPNTYVARFEIVPDKGEVETAEIIYHREGVPTPANH